MDQCNSEAIVRQLQERVTALEEIVGAWALYMNKQSDMMRPENLTREYLAKKGQTA